MVMMSYWTEAYGLEETLVLVSMVEVPPSS